MTTRWLKSEVEQLKYYKNKGYTTIEIAKFIPGRTFRSIQSKLLRLDIAIDMQAWTEEEIQELKYLRLLGYPIKTIARYFQDRSEDSIKSKLRNIKCLKPKPGEEHWEEGELLTIKELFALGTSVNDIIEYFPDRGISCVKNKVLSLKPSIKPNKVIVKTYKTYLIYIKALNLYKIGHTYNIEYRIKDLGVSTKLIFYREFNTRKEAYKLEQQWLQNVKPYRYNSNMLKSGNTETFQINE